MVKDNNKHDEHNKRSDCGSVASTSMKVLVPLSTGDGHEDKAH